MENDVHRSSVSSKEQNLKSATKQQSRKWTGYIFAVFSAFMNANGAMFYKMTSDNKLKVVLIRFICQYLIILPMMSYKRISMSGDNLQINILLLLRGILSPLAMSFIGISLNHLSLGDSTSIFYTFPSLVVFLACLFLKGKKKIT